MRADYDDCSAGPTIRADCDDFVGGPTIIADSLRYRHKFAVGELSR